MATKRVNADGAVIQSATITYRAIVSIPEDLVEQLITAGQEKDIETIEAIERILRGSNTYSVEVTRKALLPKP